MPPRPDTGGDDPGPTAPPATPDQPETTASTVIEAPQSQGRDPLDAHDFASGGGSGGAEAFSRQRLKAGLRRRSSESRPG